MFFLLNEENAGLLCMHRYKYYEIHSLPSNIYLADNILKSRATRKISFQVVT